MLFDFTSAWIDLTGIQLSDRTHTDMAFIGNSGHAVSKGVEFTTGYRITDGLQLGFNGGRAWTLD